MKSRDKDPWFRDAGGRQGKDRQKGENDLVSYHVGRLKII